MVMHIYVFSVYNKYTLNTIKEYYNIKHSDYWEYSYVLVKPVIICYSL